MSPSTAAPQPHQPGRFIALLFGLVGAGLLGVGAVNLVVDPYDIWRVVPLSFLPNRPEQIFHDRMHKAHEVRRARPDAVLLGTSRTQVGLDPHSAAFAGVAERAVNAALSDGQPKEALRFLMHAHAQRPVKVAVMGLDFLSFELGQGKNPEFTEERMATDADGRRKAGWRWKTADLVPTLLTEHAARASLHTLRKRGEPSYFHDGGQRNTTFMEQRIEEQGGQRKNFLHSERDYLGSYACYRFVDDDGRSPTLLDLWRLLEYARAEKIALRLFFSPSHARAQLVVKAAGLLDHQDAWKQAIVGLVAQAREKGADVEVWDFSGAGRYTGEPVPAMDDATSRTTWYWESSHYKGNLGDLVLARLLGRPDTEASAGFGARLTPENVAGEVARVRAEVLAYEQAHPDEAAELQQAALDVVPARRTEERCGPPGPPPARVRFGLDDDDDDDHHHQRAANPNDPKSEVPR